MTNLQRFYGGILFIFMLVTGFNLQSINAGTNDSVFSYLELPKTVKHDFINYSRGKTGKNWNNVWAGSRATTRELEYWTDNHPAGYRRFTRHQSKMIPGDYYERFIWDNIANPAASTWLYLNYASQQGDILANNPTVAECRANLLKCDFVLVGGQQWIKNVKATPSQGKPTSPSLTIFDSSSIGPGQGHYWFARGRVAAVTHDRSYGQIWKRNNWNNSIFKNYAAAINNTPGWVDPPVAANASITLNPRYVYILRQYSGCLGPTSTPWNNCTVFEDHIYAKSANNKRLGEVMIVIGLTPGFHPSWRARGYWAVIIVDIAKN